MELVITIIFTLEPEESLYGLAVVVVVVVRESIFRKAGSGVVNKTIQIYDKLSHSLHSTYKALLSALG